MNRDFPAEERKRTVRFLAGLLAVFLLAGAAVALAAPRVQSPQECGVYADMVLVVSAAAKNKVPRASVEAMLTDIYTFGSDDAREITKRIVRLAYEQKDLPPPGALSKLFMAACMRTEGNVDGLLGTDL